MERGGEKDRQRQGNKDKRKKNMSHTHSLSEKLERKIVNKKMFRERRKDGERECFDTFDTLPPVTSMDLYEKPLIECVLTK